jgi:hypothetical protein
MSVPESVDQICEKWYASYNSLKHPNAVLINTQQSAISDSMQDAQICGIDLIVAISPIYFRLF